MGADGVGHNIPVDDPDVLVVPLPAMVDVIQNAEEQQVVGRNDARHISLSEIVDTGFLWKQEAQ